MTIHSPSNNAQIWNVAPKLGVDLARVIAGEVMTPADLSEMLLNCARCWHTKKCARWQYSARGQVCGQMPAFCASRDILNDVAAR
ncbi:DUF6455 family protein [Pararhodobacter zhoushanensis]|uniref:DUF6455 family protein n=1 Tax=Pararhodobacter zhoushanensis TaxID=2479545 RepID=UPI000F8D6CDE|nr:DUF6455 family protein [Pararhodobacter zhoushanensis]